MTDLAERLKKARTDLDIAIHFIECVKLAVKGLDSGAAGISIGMTLEAACSVLAECDDPIYAAIKSLQPDAG